MDTATPRNFDSGTYVFPFHAFRRSDEASHTRNLYITIGEFRDDEICRGHFSLLFDDQINLIDDPENARENCGKPGTTKRSTLGERFALNRWALSGWMSSLCGDAPKRCPMIADRSAERAVVLTIKLDRSPICLPSRNESFRSSAEVTHHTIGALCPEMLTDLTNRGP